VLIGSVIGNQIENDLDALRMGFGARARPRGPVHVGVGVAQAKAVCIKLPTAHASLASNRARGSSRNAQHEECAARVSVSRSWRSSF
jgi:hypothetical protein